MVKVMDLPAVGAAVVVSNASCTVAVQFVAGVCCGCYRMVASLPACASRHLHVFAFV